MSLPIHNISPSYGVQAGTSIIIQAFNGGLGASQPGGVQLTLTGPSAETHTVSTFTSWSDFQVSFVMPSFTNQGAWTAAFTAVLFSNTLTFDAVSGTGASITSVTSPVAVGASATLTGTFPASQGSNFVQLDITGGIYGPITCSITAYSSTSITVTIPPNANGGFPPGALHQIAFWNPGRFPLVPPFVYATANIFLEGNPSITLTDPPAGVVAPNQTFAIGGFGFGLTQGSTTVTFNTESGVPAPITPIVWGTVAPGQTGFGQQVIEFHIPAGADLGSDSIVWTNGIYTAQASITVQNPLALPGGTQGTRNEPVSITGSGFGASFGTLTYVSVNGNPSSATPTDWSATFIRTNIPGNADFASGTFYVFPNGSARENGIFGGFTVGTQAGGPATTLFPVGALVTSFLTDGTYPIHPPNVFPIGVVQSVGSGVNTYNVAWLNSNNNEYTEISSVGSTMVPLGGLATSAQSVLGVYPPVVIEGG